MPDGPETAPGAVHGRRGDLEAQRLRLWSAIDLAEPKEVAALSRELRAVNAELASLPNPQEDSKVVDLRARIARKQKTAGL